MGKFHQAFVIGAITAGVFGGPSAHSLTFNSAGGVGPTAAQTWTNPIGPGTALSTVNYTTGTPSGATTPYTVSWGDPATSNGQSSLTWTGNNPNVVTSPGTFYLLGTLLHNNRPVFGGTAIDGVTLNIDLQFSDPIASDVENLAILINETVNTDTTAQCDPLIQISGTPCDDQITVPNEILTDIQLPGGQFIAVDLLFGTNISGPPNGTNTIVSAENASNPLYLFGSFKLVPLPAPFGALIPLALLSRIVRRYRKRLNEAAS